MAFSIARQPLVPAFLTLLAVTLAAVWQIGGDLPAAAESIAAAPRQIALLPSTALGHFQTACPLISQFIAGFLLLTAGIRLGRLASRYGLYGGGCCLAIPLYGIIACTIPTHSDYLAAFTASLLLVLATQNFCRTYRNDYAFDAIFRASVYLGLLPFILPASLPLLLLLPFSVLLFQRTLRELIAALVGLLLPGLVICYIAWGQGSDFTAPLRALWEQFIGGAPLQILLKMPIPALGAIVGIALLTLAAILLFAANAYGTGSKPRLILIYSVILFFLTTTLFIAPAATPGVMALLAVPAGLLLPVLFVRIHHAIATPLYLILLIAAFAGIFLL